MRTPPRSDGDPHLPLLLWEVQQLARTAGRLFEQAVGQAGITAADFGVLACINDEPGLTQAQIARRLQVRPQSLTRTIDKLLRGGHVHGARPGRGRPAPLRLTDNGRATLDAAWPHVVALNAPEALGLSAERARLLVEDLRRLRERLALHPEPGVEPTDVARGRPPAPPAGHDEDGAGGTG